MFAGAARRRQSLLWGALICGLLVTGCHRQGRVVAGADWGFLDPGERNNPLARLVSQKSRKSDDPFLSETVDDAPLVAEVPEASLTTDSAVIDDPGTLEKAPVTQSARSLPLAGSKTLPEALPFDVPDAEVRAMANRPALARRFTDAPPPRLVEDPEPGRFLHAPDPAPDTRAPELPLATSEPLPPASDAPLAQQPAVHEPVESELIVVEDVSPEPEETVAILPEGNVPLPETSVQITPLSDSVVLLESPTVSRLRLEDLRREPSVAGPAAEPRPVTPPASGQVAFPAPAASREAVIPTARLSGRIEVEDGLPASRRPPPVRRRGVGEERPQRLPAQVASDPLVGSDRTDVLAPAPLSESIWPRLTTASRSGLFVGLTGLAGLALWRFLERRRFQAASRP